MTLKTLTAVLVLAGASLLPAGCTVTEAEAARVDCGAPGPQGVDCQVRRTGGSGGFEACWELVISCRNGGRMAGAACHPMAAGADEGVQNIPVAAFSNQAACDVPASGAVEGLKISPQ